MHAINKRFAFTLLLPLLTCVSYAQSSAGSARNQQALTFFKADNPFIQYTGRIDFSNPALPRFWSPGVYIKAAFKGSYCEVVLNDEVLYGNSHNYVEIIIDNKKPYRMQLKSKKNMLKAAGKLSEGEHTITICKNTEAGIGYLEFEGLKCKELVRVENKALRKIEFIGNSITCGTGSDLSEIPCDSGQWYNQHNAYLSYGPSAARSLKAQWHLTAVSGIGLIHSCCNMSITMPEVFDKINMRQDSIAWNFAKYQPQVVTVCLGQNDGIQDSTKFCSAYVKFIETIRSHYARADIVCLTSPMGDEKLTAALKNYLSGVVNYMHIKGDKMVTCYFFSKQYHNGCGGHPNLAEHSEIAKELSGYIKKLKGW